MGWGGQYFSKMSVIEKCLKCTMVVGWGFNPNWDSVKFSSVLLVTPSIRYDFGVIFARVRVGDKISK